MVISHAKVKRVAEALNNLRYAVRRFRDAQHSVMFQMTNPSLAFEYSFKTEGEEMEKARLCLKDAMEEAESAEAGLSE
jgi:hypothetical protein